MEVGRLCWIVYMRHSLLHDSRSWILRLWCWNSQPHLWELTRRCRQNHRNRGHYPSRHPCNSYPGHCIRSWYRTYAWHYRWAPRKAPWVCFPGHKPLHHPGLCYGCCLRRSLLRRYHVLGWLFQQLHVHLCIPRLLLPQAYWNSQQAILWIGMVRTLHPAWYRWPDLWHNRFRSGIDGRLPRLNCL